MSEAAAAAPAAPAAPTTTQPAAPAAGATDAKSAQAQAQEWDASAESQLFELIRKSPYGKLKANGREEVLDSPDKLKAALLDAARGRGASKLAEEAKREKAEAAQVKQRAQLLERALEGDAEALRALGRVRPEERQAQEKALAELPPEVRAVIEENEALRQQLEQRLAAEEQAKAQAEQAKAQALQRQYRDEGLGMARKLIEKLGAAETAEGMLPYVLEAWRDLTNVGLEAGQDVGEEHVLTLAQQLFEQDTDKRFDRLAPKTFLGSALRRLEALPPEDVVSSLSEKTARRWAKAIAQRLQGAKAQTAAAPKPAAPASPAARTVETIARQPLSPFRFGR